MKKTPYTIFCAAVTLLGGEASAYLTQGNQPLDYAFCSSNDPPLVVAGRIVEKDVRPRPPVVDLPEVFIRRAPRDPGPPDVTFKFEVTTVLLGQQTHKGRTLVIPATRFDWPSELLAFQEGVQCALILRTNREDRLLGRDLCSVVPVSNAALRTAKDGDEAKRILGAELLAVLRNETSGRRQRHLILQLAPILHKADSAALVPFLKSEDAWLRRAALAGLVCATKEKSYLTLAHQDIERFIEATGPTGMIKPPEGGLGLVAPYPVLFRHYFFFMSESCWWEGDAAATACHLPLFRLVAHSQKVPERDRWSYGLWPLCRSGTREDAKFLYEYCRDRKGAGKEEVLGSYPNRQEIIMAISRILNLGLPNCWEPDFLKKEEEQHRGFSDASRRDALLKKEQEQHREISDALLKEGIIKAGEVHSHPDRGSEGEAENRAH